MTRKTSEVNAYMRYAGLAFQIFGILAIGAFVGQWLDKKLGLTHAWITIVLILFLFIGIIYKIVLETQTKKK